MFVCAVFLISHVSDIMRYLFFKLGLLNLRPINSEMGRGDPGTHLKHHTVCLRQVHPFSAPSVHDHQRMLREVCGVRSVLILALAVSWYKVRLLFTWGFVSSMLWGIWDGPSNEQDKERRPGRSSRPWGGHCSSGESGWCWEKNSSSLQMSLHFVQVKSEWDS